jgi:hypothetical protein
MNSPMEGTAPRLAKSIRLAAFLSGLSGVGVGATTPLVILSYEKTGYLPEAPFGLGFQLLAGPLEELGSVPFIALGWVLFAVSLLDIVAAIQLWSRHRRGAVLGIATSPVVFALGIGFAVPSLLVTAGLRVALVAVGWSSLRWSSTKARS